MFGVFNVIPTGFFNNLASGSNQRIYADCIQLIYKEYEREISYRIPRNRIRDTLAIYFLENHVELSNDEYSGDRTANDMAGAVIRKFLSKEIGWLDEEIDDTTYEKQIVMTENGIALAEFLNKLEKPEQEEFSSYIYNIYNTLNNAEQWKENPYVNGIKNINKNARDLSKALKKLSTFIRKIIEKMVQETTLESLTENILEYCEGNFIREYSRLTKQQNIHIYRMFIKTKLDEMIADDVVFGRIAQDCAKEENITYEQAEDTVLDMIQVTKRFLVEDYDQIMRDIKHKINVYLQIAVGRARFIRNREKDVRGNVERTMRYIMEEMTEYSMKDELPEEMDALFTLNRHEFIDEGSIRFPRQNQSIKTPVAAEIEEMTEETIEAARKAQQKEAYNPYSRDLMKLYLEKKMGDSHEITSDELPLNCRGDMLANLSSVAYARDNGFFVELLDGYYEANDMILRRFKIVREEKE
ncbi:MAG: DUF5716 family protein [Lachnospiraceae bacterium]|nr:DUF5716 family protein [Lachnospiraceae bacterium]